MGDDLQFDVGVPHTMGFNTEMVVHVLADLDDLGVPNDYGNLQMVWSCLVSFPIIESSNCLGSPNRSRQGSSEGALAKEDGAREEGHFWLSETDMCPNIFPKTKGKNLELIESKFESRVILRLTVTLLMGASPDTARREEEIQIWYIFDRPLPVMEDL